MKTWKYLTLLSATAPALFSSLSADENTTVATASEHIDENSPWEEQLKAIDTELRDLVIQVHDLRRKALNSEVDSQPLMRPGTSGQAYAEKIEEVEEDRTQATALEGKIRDLLRKRQELLQNNVPSEETNS